MPRIMCVFSVAAELGMGRRQADWAGWLAVVGGKFEIIV